MGALDQFRDDGEAEAPELPRSDRWNTGTSLDFWAPGESVQIAHDSTPSDASDAANPKRFDEEGEQGRMASGLGENVSLDQPRHLGPASHATRDAPVERSDTPPDADAPAADVPDRVDPTRRQHPDDRVESSQPFGELSPQSDEHPVKAGGRHELPHESIHDGGTDAGDLAQRSTIHEPVGGYTTDARGDDPASELPTHTTLEMVDVPCNAEQREFLDRDFDLEDLHPTPGVHSDAAYRVYGADGSAACYKPQSGEKEGLRIAVEHGDHAKHEVAAYLLDRHLGTDVVPVTAWTETGAKGAGSLQEWQDQPRVDIGQYNIIDRQRVGVFDYVAGNLDRHDENYVSDATGRPAAIDNGLCLPDSYLDPIKSVFFESILDQPLNQGLVQSLRSVDEVRLTSDLSACGVTDAAVSGVLSRLHEAQSGYIDGRSWLGGIQDGMFNVIR